MSGRVSCRGGGGGGREPVKIVVINTQYVETDETSFKSVVQELTGKDSGAVSKKKKNVALAKSRKVRPCSGMQMEEGIIHQSAGTEICRSSNSPFKRDLSFKEFDRLLKEMPPVDEFYSGCWPA